MGLPLRDARCRGQLFSFSGTNAHVVVADVPQEEPAREAADGETACSSFSAALAEPSCHVLPLSARTEKALAELAGRYERMLEEKPGLNLADVSTPPALAARFLSTVWQLRRQLRGGPGTGRRLSARPGASVGSTRPGRHDLSARRGFHVPQGKGRTMPAWGANCSTRSPYSGLSLNAAPNSSGPISKSPSWREALFAARHAIGRRRPAAAAPWTKPITHPAGDLRRGLRPLRCMAVLGHRARQAVLGWGVSGEYAAACVAGVFSLEDGLRLVAERGRLTPALSRASQSPLATPGFSESEPVAKTIQFAEPRIAIVSAATGEMASPDLMTSPGYWVRHLRQPARFTDSIRRALRAARA